MKTPAPPSCSSNFLRRPRTGKASSRHPAAARRPRASPSPHLTAGGCSRRPGPARPGSSPLAPPGLCPSPQQVPPNTPGPERGPGPGRTASRRPRRKSRAETLTPHRGSAALRRSPHAGPCPTRPTAAAAAGLRGGWRLRRALHAALRSPRRSGGFSGGEAAQPPPAGRPLRASQGLPWRPPPRRARRGAHLAAGAAAGSAGGTGAELLPGRSGPRGSASSRPAAAPPPLSGGEKRRPPGKETPARRGAGRRPLGAGLRAGRHFESPQRARGGGSGGGGLCAAAQPRRGSPGERGVEGRWALAGGARSEAFRAPRGWGSRALVTGQLQPVLRGGPSCAGAGRPAPCRPPREADLAAGLPLCPGLH